MTSKVIRGRPVSLSSLFEEEESPKVIDEEVLVAHDKARRVLEEARRDAADIVMRAEERSRELERRAEEAARSALEEARRRGRAEGLARWEGLVVDHRQEMERAIEESKPRLVELAIEVAEKVLRRRLEEERLVVLPMLEELLRKTPVYRGGKLRVYLHARDLTVVKESREDLLARDPRWANLELVLDEEISPGGCRIETDFGSIDATVDTQLDALRMLLVGGEGTR